MLGSVALGRLSQLVGTRMYAAGLPVPGGGLGADRHLALRRAQRAKVLPIRIFQLSAGNISRWLSLALQRQMLTLTLREHGQRFL